MNRVAFFSSIRKSLFKNKMSTKQVEGMNYLLDVWERDYARENFKHLAYCLATAYWETAHTLMPIREYMAKSGTNLARRQAQYKPYYGRGYVQLTWKANYRKATKYFGRDFVNRPDDVMIPEYAAKILFTGCIEGWFTGKKLGDYIKTNKKDYIGARRVVNGTDRAQLIAGYAAAFEAALTAAKADTQPDPEEDTPDPTPTGKTVLTSKTAGAAAAQAVVAAVAVGSTGYPDWVTYLAFGLSAVFAAYIIYERMRHSHEDGV